MKVLPKSPLPALVVLALYSGNCVLWILYKILRSLLGRNAPIARAVYGIKRESFAKIVGIPPPLTTNVFVNRAVKFDVPDEDIVLIGDVYAPFKLGTKEEKALPCVIIRTPYGRHRIGVQFARVFAERGFVCLIQDTRGRFGSGGDFFPVKNEIVDGGHTIDWVKTQAWCNGKVYLFGVSYLGLTAYAAAGSISGHHVDGCVPVLASAKSYPILYHSGSGAMSLDLALRWLWLALKLSGTMNFYRIFFPSLQGELTTALSSFPLQTQDDKLFGKKLNFFQQAIRAESEEDEFWEDKNTLCDLSVEHAPLHIVAGWYDFFCKPSFDDYVRASAAGSKYCRMTVGAWKHWDFGYYNWPSMNIALELFRPGHHSGDGQLHPMKNSISVEFIGAPTETWAIFESWPPRQSVVYTLKLRDMNPKTSSFSEYTWDPHSPTPSLGGPSFCPRFSGRLEQTSLLNRADVVCFTAEPRKEALFICGDVFIELSAASTVANTDFFVKICDCNRNTGESFNVLETLVRMTPSDWDDEAVEGSTRWHRVSSKRTKIGPIACCFDAGHAIQLMVAGGAHPLYMRNYGTGEPIAGATEMEVADHRVFHDTRLELPSVSKDSVVWNSTMAGPISVQK